MVTVTCSVCGQEVEAARASRKTCSPACRKRAQRAGRQAEEDSSSARRRAERDRKRRSRQAARELEAAGRPEAPSPALGLSWYEQRFELLPWEREWIAGVLQPDVLYAPLSVPRGNGKSTLAGLLGASAVVPDGPLTVPGTRVVCVAGSHSQAREIHDAALEVIDPYRRSAPEAWRTLDSQRLLVEHLPSATRMETRSAEPRTLHGVRDGRLWILDEPAQWGASIRDRLWAACRTSLGKVASSRAIIVGTRPGDGEAHFFERLLRSDDPAIFAVQYSAPDGADVFDEETWRSANPSWDAFPALRQVIEVEARMAQKDPSLQAGFEALRLNRGVADHTVAHLISAAAWRECERADRDLPAREGGCVWGIDLSGGSALCAGAAYWPASGRAEAMAFFPEQPSLAERSKTDNAEYLEMVQEGTLMVAGRRVVPPAALVAEMLRRWGPPAMVVADHHAGAELKTALEDAAVPLARLELVGLGWKHGPRLVRQFRRKVLDGQVQVPRRHLLRSCFANMRVEMDSSAQEKPVSGGRAGRPRRARDDAAMAMLLAVAMAPAAPARRPAPRYFVAEPG